MNQTQGPDQRSLRLIDALYASLLPGTFSSQGHSHLGHGRVGHAATATGLN